MTKPDYYEVLGVSRDASAKEIKNAFHREALRWHPDRNQGDPVTEGRFKNASEAYEVLGDPRKRIIYDSGMDPGTGRSAFTGSAFGRGRGRGCGRGRGRGCGGRFGGSAWRDADPRSTAEHTIEVILDLVEARLGGERRISFDSAAGRRVLSLHLPPGLEEGDIVRLHGIPDGGFAGDARDMYLRIRVKD